MSRTRKLTIGCGSIFIIPICVLGVNFYRAVREAEAQRIPSRLSPVERTYDSEISLGIGPGANEAGLAIYRLQNDAMERLRAVRLGSADSDTLQKVFGSSRWNYGKWKATPLTGRDRSDFLERSVLGLPAPVERVDIVNYTGKTGVEIDIDPAVRSRVNTILTTTGSFYAYGRAGAMTIISPRTKEVIFTYAG